MCRIGQWFWHWARRFSLAARVVGAVVAGTTAATPPPVLQQIKRKWRSMPASNPIGRSWLQQRPPKPLSSEFDTLRGPSRWLQSARLAAVLCLPIWIASCETWQRLVKPEPQTPLLVPVVCPGSAMMPCPAPVYDFSDATIAADVAGAVAIAESKARDACAVQLETLQGCVRDHNSKAAGNPPRRRGGGQ